MGMRFPPVVPIQTMGAWQNGQLGIDSLHQLTMLLGLRAVELRPGPEGMDVRLHYLKDATVEVMVEALADPLALGFGELLDRRLSDEPGGGHV